MGATYATTERTSVVQVARRLSQRKKRPENTLSKTTKTRPILFNAQFPATAKSIVIHRTGLNNMCKIAIALPHFDVHGRIVRRPLKLQAVSPSTYLHTRARNGTARFRDAKRCTTVKPGGVAIWRKSIQIGRTRLRSRVGERRQYHRHRPKTLNWIALSVTATTSPTLAAPSNGTCTKKSTKASPFHAVSRDVVKVFLTSESGNYIRKIIRIRLLSLMPADMKPAQRHSRPKIKPIIITRHSISTQDMGVHARHAI